MPSTLLLLAFLMSFSAPALAIYKCESGDKVIYSDAPCHGGKNANSMKTIDVAASSPDTEAAQKKLAQDKEELQRLEARRHKRDAIAEKEQQKLFKANEAKKKKCAESALRTKWANEDAADALPKSAERARQKARRVAENHQLHCGS